MKQFEIFFSLFHFFFFLFFIQCLDVIIALQEFLSSQLGVHQRSNFVRDGHNVRNWFLFENGFCSKMVLIETGFCSKLFLFETGFCSKMGFVRKWVFYRKWFRSKMVLIKTVGIKQGLFKHFSTLGIFE
jgi:hypothetical protein